MIGSQQFEIDLQHVLARHQIPAELDLTAAFLANSISKLLQQYKLEINRSRSERSSSISPERHSAAETLMWSNAGYPVNITSVSDAETQVTEPILEREGTFAGAGASGPWEYSSPETVADCGSSSSSSDCGSSSSSSDCGSSSSSSD